MVKPVRSAIKVDPITNPRTMTAIMISITVSPDFVREHDPGNSVVMATLMAVGGIGNPGKTQSIKTRINFATH